MLHCLERNLRIGFVMSDITLEAQTKFYTLIKFVFFFYIMGHYIVISLCNFFKII